MRPDNDINIFNICIDRLHQGDDLETILSDYPDRAQQLRPMLETGQAIGRIQYSPVEVQQAQQRIDPVVQQALRGSSTGGISGMVWILILVIAATLAGIWVISAGMSDDTATIEPATTVVPALIPAATIEQTALPVDISDSLVIIEGPVQDIRENSLTIYETVITFPDDDARLRGIQPDDVIRIEADQTAQGLQAIDLQIRGVTLIISETGSIWRDDNCSNPPPAWAGSGTTRWQQNCVSRGTQPRGRGGSDSGASQS